MKVNRDDFVIKPFYYLALLYKFETTLRLYFICDFIKGKCSCDDLNCQIRQNKACLPANIFGVGVSL